ncbi:MAG: response regulator [Acidimicrobiales bacterium]
MASVIVVEDHDLVRLALHTLIDPEDDISIVAEASTIESGRVAMERHRPDVLVLDLQLPDGDGLELCRLAAELGVRCLVLTAYVAEELLLDAMRAGAAGYLLKHDRPEDILNAVRTVAAGGALFSAPATAKLLAAIAAGGSTDDPLADLTDRERELLSLLGEGLSNRQIAERMYLGERTVKNYVSRLLRKLDMDRRAEAAAFAARLETERELRRFSGVAR